MNRRGFLIRVGGVLVAVPAVLQMTACGGGDDGGSPDAPVASSFTASSSGSGHTHTVTVQCSSLSASGDVTLTSSSANSHTHEVTITAAQMAMIAQGTAVTVSTTSIHPHDWTISLPSNVCPS